MDSPSLSINAIPMIVVKECAFLHTLREPKSRGNLRSSMEIPESHRLLPNSIGKRATPSKSLNYKADSQMAG